MNTATNPGSYRFNLPESASAISLQKSLVSLEQALWDIECCADSYAIGPGNHPWQPPAFGSGALPINVMGMLASEKGVGEAARTTIRSLQAVGVDATLNNFTDTGAENADRTCAQISADNPHPINLLHIGPDLFDQFLDEGGGAYLRGRFNIACWAWELPDFPRRWESHFAHINEIWVPSQFNVDTISAVAPVPVIRMPHAIAPWLPVRRCDRSLFGIPADAFCFLYVFDCASSIERKNPLGLIEAFKLAFGTGDRAMLVLKFARGHEDPTGARAIAKAAEGANISIIDEVLPRAELNALINHCDCYISLHRSEGFGLTLAEAMSLGKPVIGTNYSGNVDFMTPANSYLVDCHLVEIARSFDQYTQGSHWAQPDTRHAAALMRQVCSNPVAAGQIGRQARRDILRTLHPRVVGTKMRDRLFRCLDRRSTGARNDLSQHTRS